MYGRIVLLRARFFAAQAQQIQLLQANLARLEWRRTLLVTSVAIVITFAIAGIAYRDTSDPFVFVMPVAIAAACFWIYMAAIASLGIAILMIDRVAGVEGDDGALGDFGLVVFLVGVVGLILWGARKAQKSWQRRRIGRLLARQRPGA